VADILVRLNTDGRYFIQCFAVLAHRTLVLVMVMDLMFNAGAFFRRLDVPDWPDHLSAVLGDLDDTLGN